MRHGGIDSCSEVTYGLLNEGALAIAGSEEGEVDDKEEDAALREGEDGHRQAEQKGNFQSSDKIHAGIIVLFNEPSNGLCQRRLLHSGSATGRSSCRTGRLEGRD